MNQGQIRRALISVYDKTGIVAFAQALAALQVELISTGGTARTLREAGLQVIEIDRMTGFPEMLDGRVKTLHPKVHGGLLYKRGDPSQVRQVQEHGIEPIDLVVVNLYPFEATVARAGVTEEEAIEQIDIGGPSMIRSAAKNNDDVTVIVDPNDYDEVLAQLRTAGRTQLSTRRRLASKVFALTSRYDAAISAYLQERLEERPAYSVAAHGVLKQALRYGENPHQQAAFYAIPGTKEPSIAGARQVGGKELSYNNILDLAAALELVKDFSEPCACVIKHCNPCGAAIGAQIHDAFELAYEGDPRSAFGGILGFNRPVDAALATAIMNKAKVDAIVAPEFSAEAIQIVSTRKKWGASTILLATGSFAAQFSSTTLREFRFIPGGLLVQDRDKLEDEFANLKVVTQKCPTEVQMAGLRFAMQLCKHVKSNAIVLTQGTMLVGAGAGQTSRVDSVEIAVRKAGERAARALLASDAFFPFPDGVETAAQAGIAAIIQPGGSVKDDEVIATADRLGLTMVFTGVRHFRH